MDCSGCENKIKKALKKLKGIATLQMLFLLFPFSDISFIPIDHMDLWLTVLKFINLIVRLLISSIALDVEIFMI